MTPCTDDGPERETSVRATSPINPTVPPPYTNDMFAAAIAFARSRAADMCAGDFPGEEPQNTHIFVGFGWWLFVVWESVDGVEVRDSTGVANEAGETPPDSILFTVYM